VKRRDFLIGIGALAAGGCRCPFGGSGIKLANAFPDNPQWIDESRAYFESLI
jgi:hypothetical protein